MSDATDRLRFMLQQARDQRDYYARLLGIILVLDSEGYLRLPDPVMDAARDSLLDHSPEFMPPDPDSTPDLFAEWVVWVDPERRALPDELHKLGGGA